MVQRATPPRPHPACLDCSSAGRGACSLLACTLPACIARPHAAGCIACIAQSRTVGPSAPVQVCPDGCYYPRHGSTQQQPLNRQGQRQWQQLYGQGGRSRAGMLLARFGRGARVLVCGGTGLAELRSSVSDAGQLHEHKSSTAHHSTLAAASETLPAVPRAPAVLCFYKCPNSTHNPTDRACMSSTMRQQHENAPTRPAGAARVLQSRAHHTVQA
jgi:hypothetical protein